MDIFQSILSKLQERFVHDGAQGERIAALVQSITNVPITASDVSIKKGVLTLSVSPTAKMAILTKREGIITACKEIGVVVGTIV